MRMNRIVEPDTACIEFLARRALSIQRERKRSWYKFVAYPICLSVCLCGKCIVAKRLIGSACRGVVSGVSRGMVVISVRREYVFYVFFQISKKHDFLRFFEMMYQKVVKRR